MKLHYSNNYSQELYNFLSKEGIEGYRASAYVDSVGKPTIGVGYNLHDSATNRNLVLQTLGFDVSGTQLTGDAAATEQAYIQLITEILTSNNYPATQAGTQQLQNDLAVIMQARSQDTHYTTENTPSIFTRRTTFTFSSETESRTVFDSIITSYENDVFTQIRNAATSIGKTLDEANAFIDSLRGTTELEALVSLKYTGVNFPATAKALLSDNRAEAWYEIRYNSNGDRQHASRRYSESGLFGLYDNGPLSRDQEIALAKEIMRMWIRHGAEIAVYEQKYPPSASGAWNGALYVQPIAAALAAAFAPGQTIDNIIVGAGSESYAKIETNHNDTIAGTDKNDLIFGEAGADVLNGMEGADVIYGGKGKDIIYGGSGNNSDTLYGGEDDDTYIVNSGDGVDTIEDKEGGNTVREMTL